MACNDSCLRVLDRANQWRELWLSDPKRESRRAGGAVAWSPDGRMVTATDSIGNLATWCDGIGPRITASKGNVTGMGWSPDGMRFAHVTDISGGALSTGPEDPGVPIEPSGHARSLAWSPDGSMVAVSFFEGQEVEVWDSSGNIVTTLRGHFKTIWDVAWSTRNVLASGSTDSTIRLWRPPGPTELRVLEEHTGSVHGVSFSPGGELLASLGADRLILWRCDTWEPVWDAAGGGDGVFGVAFHPTEPLLAARGPTVKQLRIFHINIPGLIGVTPSADSVHYAAAKIVLVGDSGVGKTGLGWRMAHGEFKEHPSTHGQQFWPLGSLADQVEGVEREAVLWDLAGQPDYRLIHSLFLDDADLALVLFDLTERREPLKGVEFWLKALAHRRDGPCPVILVGARADRGSLTLPPDEIESFCRQAGVSGRYVETSAAADTGVEALIDRIREQVPWDRIPPTVTTRTFKRVKEFVLNLKTDATTAGDVLVEAVRLRSLLQIRDPDWAFSDAEMLTAVQHLARHGYVRLLQTAKGGQVVLLQPELLNNLAASFVLEARRNPKGLGALDEGTVLQGGYAFPELVNLAPRDAATLLDAACSLFLEHNTCFRQSLGDRTFLIFPELINLRKPSSSDIDELAQDTAFAVVGAVQNVYAILVVLLGYTNLFARTHQWQDEARYEMAGGQVCAFRLLEEREGELEFALYYGNNVTLSQMAVFQGLFETILEPLDVTVSRHPVLVCPNCQYRQDRSQVIRRARDGRPNLFCDECGQPIALPGAGEPLTLSRAHQGVVRGERLTARRRTDFESALTRLKGFIRYRFGDAPAPTCFISYAWGNPDHERWVDRSLAEDLTKADIAVLLDRRDNAEPGSSIARFVERIESSEWIVVVGTPLYLAKHGNDVSPSGSVVASEMDLILQRLTASEEQKRSVIPALLQGEPEQAFPPLLRGRVYEDFRRDETYFVTLFDLILSLHRIPLNEPAIADLRDRIASGV